MTFALLSGNSNAVELASEQYTRPSGSRYTTIACLLPGMMTDLIILPSCTTTACVSPRSSLANCSTDYQRPGHCCAAPESPMHQQHCTNLLLDPFPACPFWPADRTMVCGKLCTSSPNGVATLVAACSSHRLPRTKPLLRLHRLLLPCSARSEELLLMHRARLQQPGLGWRRRGPTCIRLGTVTSGHAKTLIKSHDNALCDAHLRTSQGNASGGKPSWWPACCQWSRCTPSSLCLSAHATSYISSKLVASGL